MTLKDCTSSPLSREECCLSLIWETYQLYWWILYMLHNILNNDSESSKLHVDLFHAVNQVYFAQEEQAKFKGIGCVPLEWKLFSRNKEKNLLTNNEEVVNGTDSLITWERRGEPERLTLKGKKWVNKVYDHRFYATLASHWTLYWNFLFLFLSE